MSFSSKFKPKTYGLVVRKKGQSTSRNVTGSSTSGLFNEDDSSDEEIDQLDKDNKRLPESIRNKNKVNADIRKTSRLTTGDDLALKKALREDESIFDYDIAHDGIVAKRNEEIKAKLKGSGNGPKYLGSLMKKAEQRKRDQEAMIDRREHRMREKESGELGTTEVIITASYKRRLKERQEQEERERKHKLDEEDVTKKGDLSGFYTGLLSVNEAYGGKAKARKEGSLSHADNEKARNEGSTLRYEKSRVENIEIHRLDQATSVYDSDKVKYVSTPGDERNYSEETGTVHKQQQQKEKGVSFEHESIAKSLGRKPMSRLTTARKASQSDIEYAREKAVARRRNKIKNG